jgi:hypothetical protein
VCDWKIDILRNDKKLMNHLRTKILLFSSKNIQSKIKAKTGKKGNKKIRMKSKSKNVRCVSDRKNII